MAGAAATAVAVVAMGYGLVYVFRLPWVRRRVEQSEPLPPDHYLYWAPGAGETAAGQLGEAAEGQPGGATAGQLSDATAAQQGPIGGVELGSAASLAAVSASEDDDEAARRVVRVLGGRPAPRGEGGDGGDAGPEAYGDDPADARYAPYAPEALEAQRLSRAVLAGAAADAVLANLGNIDHLLNINWDVLRALDFAYTADLSNFDRLHAVVHEGLNLDPEQAAGWLARLHGYVAEQVAADTLTAQGHHVEFPATSNQAGYDLVVDGHLVQIKDGLDPHAIHEHLQAHPDIPVITSPEMAAQFHDVPGVTGLPELNHDAIHDATLHTVQSVDAIHSGLHFPLITMVVSGVRELRLLSRNATDFVALAQARAALADGTERAQALQRQVQNDLHAQTRQLYVGLAEVVRTHAARVHEAWEAVRVQAAKLGKDLPSADDGSSTPQSTAAAL